MYTFLRLHSPWSVTLGKSECALGFIFLRGINAFIVGCIWMPRLGLPHIYVYDIYAMSYPWCLTVRAGPFTKAVDEEVESQHLRFIQSPPSNMDFPMAVNRFNCNISYSGLLHAVTAEVRNTCITRGMCLLLLDSHWAVYFALMFMSSFTHLQYYKYVECILRHIHCSSG